MRPFEDYLARYRHLLTQTGEYDIIKRWPRVNVDDVYRWYKATDDDDWSFESGKFTDVIKPPFQSMVLDAADPGITWFVNEITGEMFDELIRPLIGNARVTEKSLPDSVQMEIPEPRHSERFVTIEAVGCPDGSYVYFWPMDEDGVAHHGGGFVLPLPNGYQPRLMTWVAKHRGTLPAVPHLALCLFQCRNISVVREPPVPSKVRRAREKRGKVVLAYERLVVPFPKTASQSEARDSAGAVQPLHLVRGHFKTYTPDAPLFGSRTGTFWWGHQVRGVSDAGRISKTYRPRPA